MSWTQSYLAKSQERTLQPVYALVICNDWTYARPSDTLLEDAVGRTETSIQLAASGDFTINAGDDLWIYDVGGFEILNATEWTQGSQLIATATRGQHGTTAKAFDRGSVVAHPLVSFATGAVGNTTWHFRGGMSFPSGGRQEIDVREGRTRWDEVTLSVLDGKGELPKLFKGRSVIGMRAIILGGYAGMDLEQFSFLHVGQITSMEIEAMVRYTFSIDSILQKLNVDLFEDVEDFTTTLTASMNSSQITMSVADLSTAYDSINQLMGLSAGWEVGSFLRAGVRYKVENEWMVGEGTTGSTTINLASTGRGEWNTTAASHASGKAVDMAFGFDGHPVDFLIGLLLTRPKFDTNESLAYKRDATYYWDWYSAVDNDRGALSLGIDFGDIEISTFHEIRNRWFPDYIFRYKIGKKQSMESFIPKHILKPLGLALYVNRAGRLALMIQQPPLSSVIPRQLTRSDIVGIPTLMYDNEEVVTAARIKFDYDGADFTDELLLIDAASQIAYDRQDEVTLECIGLDSNWRADTISERIARRKLRPIKDPNPLVPLELLFTHSGIELGDIVQVTHPDLPDIFAGVRGWNKYVIVLAKNVRWDDGTLEVDIADTKYYGKRYGLIAPSGQADYVNASDDAKLRYVFIADSPTDLLSDGSTAYLVI